MQRFVSHCAWIGLAMLSMGAAHGQPTVELLADSNAVITFGTPKARGPAQRSVCADQPLLYAQAKVTALAGLDINNTTSAQAGGQWYDTPAPIELTGATFYAYVVTPPGSINVTVAVYASDANKLPLGAPLATEVMTLTTELGGGTLPELQQTVNFATPLVINGPYIVAVENRSPTSMGLISNSYTAADGAGEFLASVDLFGNWTLGSDVNVGGTPFDADWLIEPIVRFDLLPVVTAVPACLTGPATVDLTADSPFMESRFFDQDAFAGATDANYVWDFNDASPPANGASQSHDFTFMGSAVFQPAVTATLNGWTATCVETVSTPVGTLPTAAFTWVRNGLTVDFVGDTTSADSVMWDFGDGNTSSQNSPSHTYAASGDYIACLVADNATECPGDPGPEPGSVEYCENLGTVPVELQSFSID